MLIEAIIHVHVGVIGRKLIRQIPRSETLISSLASNWLLRGVSQNPGTCINIHKQIVHVDV